MNRIQTTLITTLALSALSGAAVADDKFDATFAYAPTAPVAETYAHFERTAKRACKVDYREAGGLRHQGKIEHLCTTQLVADAVAATQFAPLIAYHQQHINSEQWEQQLADRRSQP